MIVGLRFTINCFGKMMYILYCSYCQLLADQQSSAMKEGHVLFNDTLNTFYSWLYGVKHMVKDSERGNLLPDGFLFSISSKVSFICIIPQAA